jgi:hypothetical protein
LRFSLGLHSTATEITTAVQALDRLMRGLG